MLVKATRLGYFGIKRYREGAKFHIKSENEFSEIWMKKITEDADDSYEDSDDSIEEIVKPKKRRKAKAQSIDDDITGMSDEDVI